MPKLSKTKQYAVKYLSQQGLSPEDISKELKVSVDQVKSLITTDATEPAANTKPAKGDKTKELMIRQTSGKKINSVSIMTQAAAQLSDEFLKNIEKPANSTDKYIFRPK